MQNTVGVRTVTFVKAVETLINTDPKASLMKELIYQNMKVILDIAIIIKYYSYISIVENDRVDIARKLDTYTIDDIYALPDGVCRID